jgi:hypothetical protein
VYCPRCGSQVRAGEAGASRCARTGALLTSAFLEELEGYSVPAEDPRPAHPLTCDPEGTWFCLDCGCRMTPRPGFVDCPECGKGFNGFVNALLKSNPHP